jgi:hypothetical protein
VSFLISNIDPLSVSTISLGCGSGATIPEGLIGAIPHRVPAPNPAASLLAASGSGNEHPDGDVHMSTASRQVFRPARASNLLPESYGHDE